MNLIDPNGLANYNAGIEVGRLHRGLGLIEFARTKEILLEELPPAPAVIYDIGGAYGEYAFFLVEHGYEVHLFDLAEEHIRLAKANENAAILADAVVADARRIPRKTPLRMRSSSSAPYTTSSSGKSGPDAWRNAAGS